jgi:phosphonopyruvate decarboxylase
MNYSEKIKDKLNLLKESEGPVLLEIKINLRSRKDLGRPTRNPMENKKDFMEFIN